MITVPIPGGFASLLEPLDLKVRQRRVIEVAAMTCMPALAAIQEATGGDSQATDLSSVRIDKLQLSEQDAEAMFKMQDATIVVLLAGWTLDLPLPTMETVGDLSTDVYDALALATKTMGSAVARGVDFDPTPDQSRPTGAFDASDGLSKAAEGTSTQLLPPTGENTSTASSTP